MLLCADAAADLAGGLLACPSCGTGRLARWGHGRERIIRCWAARPRGCGRTGPAAGPAGGTHIVLPSLVRARCADAIEVIGTGLAAALWRHIPGVGNAHEVFGKGKVSIAMGG